MAESAERVLPHNVRAEQSVIGSILLWPEIIEEVSTLITPSDLFLSAHQLIFSALLDQFKAGRPIEVGLLRADLEQRGWLDDIGGSSYLGELFDTPVTAANTAYHCQLIRSAALSRMMIETVRATAIEIYRDDRPPHEVLDETSLAWEQLRERSDQSRRRKARRLADILAGPPPPQAAVIWGDSGSPYIVEGQATILFAREGEGKSWLAFGLAHAITAGAGRYLDAPVCDPAAVLYASAEFNDAEMFRRGGKVMDGEAASSSLWVMSEEDLFAEGSFDLLADGDTAWMIRAAKRFKARLIILDPIANLWTGEENNRDFKRLIDSVRRIRIQTGAAVLLLHHESRPPKGAGSIKPVEDRDAIRGGTVLPGGVRSTLRLAKKNGLHCLVHTKSNMGQKAETVWLDMSTRYRPRVVRAPDDTAIRKEAYLREIVSVIDTAGRALTAGEIQSLAAVNVTPRTLQRYLRELGEVAAIKVIGRGSNSTYATSDRDKGGCR